MLLQILDTQICFHINWQILKALVNLVQKTNVFFSFLDHKEGWTPKNWCFWTVMLEKTLESPLHCKRIQPVNPKENQSWIFFGRIDSEAKTPILWPLDVKNWLIGKDLDAGKDWRQEEKGTTEHEMVGWHQWFSGHDSEQALGVGDGQGGLVCCSPWGHEESDTTEWLKWTELSQSYGFSNSNVWIWELDHKEGLAPKNWCFWTVVLEKTLESPFDWKEIQPIHPKGN